MSEGQRLRLAKGYQNNLAITVRLARNKLNCADELMLTKTQINRIQKAMKNSVGVDMKISKTPIRKAVEYSGSLFSSLMSLGSKFLPMGMPLAKMAMAPIATDSLSGLASLGVDKIFGKGLPSGGFMISQNKVIDQFIKYKNLFTTTQKKQILEA